MNAQQLLANRRAYIQYNYGNGHPLTVAAERGEIEGFRSAGTHITEMMDAVVVSIIDAQD
ncbi:TPA: hypothetical protein ACPH4X_003824 [Pseudomonas aeruginosa]|jgi:hypothetical protein|uniref:Uncharacterized protein n=1 Tax=Pseudomonas aeruginosa TaxID=287 RepID=A0A6C0L6J2_PSEAI|nr:hypothetical protein [Pseudomonas aeruginosa]EKX0430363.1 hypothetical protein [Pseudomonas aeruginosa]EMB2824041.1 hypothetical protein [Pseudomonas aeruginosa]ERX93929.1 hypothetical protein Q077_06460 [Pseudomonas aeruginosa BL23]MBV5843173.1 hypothetical protein [Pseudomonas aeruginosa]MCC9289532.1 hypothetical protein [Pseudomonas aeruginosa]